MQTRQKTGTALPLLLSLAVASGVEDPTELHASGPPRWQLGGCPGPYFSVRQPDECWLVNVGQQAGEGARELTGNDGWRGMEGPDVITGERLQVRDVTRLCCHVSFLLVACR